MAGGALRRPRVRDLFLLNVVVACLLVFLGTQLGVGSAMTTAVVVVLGIRIFSNTASIRRLLLKA